MSYKYTQLSGYATIDGTDYDVARMSVHYAINKVPVASIGVATGSPAFGGGSAAVLMEKFSRQKTMKLYVDASAPGTIPGGSKHMMIFDGKTASVSLISEPGLRGIQVNGVNWLVDLMASGAFSSKRTAHAFWELVPQVTMFSSAGVTEPTLSMEGIPSKITEKGDLFATMDHMVKYVAGGLASQDKFKNDTALTAWKRINGDLIFSFDPVTSVVTGVTETVTSGFLALHKGGVIMDSLLMLGDTFFFVLSPSVSSANLVAYTPMAATAVTNLTPADYVYISQMQAARRNYAGMVLLDNNSLTSSAEIQIKEPLSIFVVNETNGVLDGAPLPAWLKQPVETSTTANTYEITAGLYGRTPNRVATPEQAATAKKTATSQWAKDRPTVLEVGNNYAQMLLGDRLFAPNSMSIKGPFRTDIVPGTVISLDVPTDVSRGNSTVKVYGFVNSVTLEIDAERALAATTINLSHVRGKDDNVSFGSKGNALYKNTFSAKNLLATSGGKTTLGAPIVL